VILLKQYAFIEKQSSGSLEAVIVKISLIERRER